MNLLVHLDAETAALLQAQAAHLGKRPEDLAREVLETNLQGNSTPQPPISADEWLRQFDAWVSGHRSRNPHVDDSRDSIYPDRG